MNKCTHLDVIILDKNQFYLHGLRHFIEQYAQQRQLTLRLFPCSLTPPERCLIFFTFETRHLLPVKSDKRSGISDVHYIFITETPLFRPVIAGYNPKKGDTLLRSDKGHNVTTLLDRLVYQNASRAQKVEPYLDLSEQPFSRRQQEILYFVAKGFGYSQIGQSLQISEKTVSQHTRNIMRRLHFKNKQMLYLWLNEQQVKLSHRLSLI